MQLPTVTRVERFLQSFEFKTSPKQSVEFSLELSKFAGKSPIEIFDARLKNSLFLIFVTFRGHWCMWCKVINCHATTGHTSAVGGGDVDADVVDAEIPH